MPSGLQRALPSTPWHIYSTAVSTIPHGISTCQRVSGWVSCLHLPCVPVLLPTLLLLGQGPPKRRQALQQQLPGLRWEAVQYCLAMLGHDGAAVAVHSMHGGGVDAPGCGPCPAGRSGWLCMLAAAGPREQCGTRAVRRCQRYCQAHLLMMRRACCLPRMYPGSQSVGHAAAPEPARYRCCTPRQPLRRRHHPMPGAVPRPLLQVAAEAWLADVAKKPHDPPLPCASEQPKCPEGIPCHLPSAA
mmetsp:Transcript_38926/g.86592  ORF Transcript_38926/g.86592 Transcript_38926/m.86592 type:complete len:244 (-) Transcript_38926:387-1118(-)